MLTFSSSTESSRDAYILLQGGEGGSPYWGKVQLTKTKPKIQYPNPSRTPAPRIETSGGTEHLSTVVEAYVKAYINANGVVLDSLQNPDLSTDMDIGTYFRPLR